ncbi:MAG TPA: phage baseplate assembly protein V [Candidatus Binatia bacterium]|nr:phage baseplate assembly protein V [Candidatus Binatia bacterium]
MNIDALRALLAPVDQSGRFYGVVVGVVTNNRDPDNMHRVKVRFPWLSNEVESNWARVATPMAGKDRGAYFLPEVNDEVLVAFEHGRVDHPYVLGCLWNGQDTAPENNTDRENNHRTIKSRSGHVVRLNDAAGKETIEIIDKSGNNKIVVNTADNSIIIEARADITIKSATGKLTLEANGIELKSQAGITAQATQSMDLKANAQVTVKGATINLN